MFSNGLFSRYLCMNEHEKNSEFSKKTFCSSQKLFFPLNFATFNCTYDLSIDKIILISLVKCKTIFLLIYFMAYYQWFTQTLYFVYWYFQYNKYSANNKNKYVVWLSLLNISCCMHINVIMPKKALCSTFVSNMILYYVFLQKSELRSFLYFSNMILMSWPSFQAFNFLSLKCFSFTVWFLYFLSKCRWSVLKENKNKHTNFSAVLW